MPTDPLILPDLLEVWREGQGEALREFLEEHHPAQIAEMIEDFEPEETRALLSMLEPRLRAEVFSYFPVDDQLETLERLPSELAAELLRFMPHDDRADLVNRLDEDASNQIMRGLAQAEREDIRRLAAYEQGTAGSVMTTDYATLSPHLSVREALDQLRREAPDRETIYTSYVVDHTRKLIGSVTLLRLIVSRPSARVEDVMNSEPISVVVTEDQEEVARKIQQYDLIAIPVVDAEQQLVGIVTHDDAMDILRQEQTEDILKFGGVSPSSEDEEETYWQTRTFANVQRRIGWLLLLFLAGTLTNQVSQYFRDVQLHIPDLADFVPLLIGTGGNAGSQTVGTIIRALALGQIAGSDLMRVLLKEWVGGMLLGLVLGLIGFLYSWVLHGNLAFAAVIGLAILFICMWANTMAALVPVVARSFRIDPAIVSAPLISTLVDATGLIIYYTTAILILMRVRG